METVPGMREMSFPAKLKMLNHYLPEKFNIVVGSVACFNIGWKGGTDEEDYGGIYYEAFSRVEPERQILLGDKKHVGCNIKIL